MSLGMSFVAVDLGASGGKLMLGTFSQSDGSGGFTLEEVYRFDNGGLDTWSASGQAKCYWDMLSIKNNIVEGLRRAARMAKSPIVSVGIDIWGADAAVLDSHGESLGEVYCYRDHRLDNARDGLFKNISPRELFDLSGIPTQPWYLLNQLYWLSQNRPDVYKLVSSVMPVGTILEHHLCGSKKAEATWMATQQLTSAGSMRYDEKILAAAGLTADILPEIAVPGEILGTLRSELADITGLADCKVVAVKSHDTASAFTAAPVVDRDKGIIISSGTWMLVGKLLDEPLLSDAVYEGGLSNEGIAGDVRLLRNVMGTWPVQQLRLAWMKADDRDISWEEMVALSEAAKPFETVIDVDDKAIFNPVDMESALREQVTRTGQNQPADRGALLRCVFEGLALKVREVNGFLARATGSEHEVVHIVGGGARNELLSKFIADACNLRVTAGPYEATAIGSIITQAVSAGLFADESAVRSVVDASLPAKITQPEPSADWDAAADRLAALKDRI